MATFTITINKHIIEFFGLSAVYIRIGRFERFYGSDVTTPH
jgi:hypothetical protein